MNVDRRDVLLDEDWADSWDTLPDAPPLVPGSKTAQITLRIPSSLLERLKAVGAAASLPYHSLARAWILEALRKSAAADNTPATDETHDDQLNLKLDQHTLDQLKGKAHELRRPYHRLAREWIEAALEREEESLGINLSPSAQPPIKDLMVLLLHSNGAQGDVAVRGITRLQKLLFVIEQNLAAQRSGFYAYNFGPFDERVNDAADALRLAGFLRGGGPVSTAGTPSFEEMMATAARKSGPRTMGEVEEFDLSDAGHAAAERLRQSSDAYGRVFERVRQLREEWDTPHLVERVYETYPKYAEKSMIREKIAERIAQRRADR